MYSNQAIKRPLYSSIATGNNAEYLAKTSHITGIISRHNWMEVANRDIAIRIWTNRKTISFQKSM